MITGCVAIYTYLRSLRTKHYNPKFVPTRFLKQKWRDWKPQTKYGHISVDSTSSPRDSRSINTSYNASSNPATQADDAASTAAAAAGVDRNTSVRSVMTLPAYSPAPKATEQVIGREGERAGMDVVVEFPETNDEEESRREEQMESLYQIRLARRQEIAEREQRRQERREARAAGDWARLEELRRESRARADTLGGVAGANGSNTNLSATMLIAEHQSRGRERRISSVSYADVGHVRHDGTRLRANSEDSDNRPLLDSAAPMGDRDGRNSVGSSLFDPPRPHFRDRSTSSILSVSTTASDLDQPPQPTPPSTSTGGNQSGLERSGSDPVTSPSIPRDTPAGSDIGESQIPPPPQYEHLEWGDAPEYESPVTARGEGPSLTRTPIYPSGGDEESLARVLSSRAGQQAQSSAPAQTSLGRIRSRAPELPALTTLPSIEVEGATPVNSVPNTPATPRREESVRSNAHET